MATRGFLIRFIDIGLIVLFGFLMISDIEASSRVELAGSGDAQDEAVDPDEEPALVVVRIAADGAFLVDVPASPSPEGEDASGEEDLDGAGTRGAVDGAAEAVRLRVTDVAGLEGALRMAERANREDGRETVVVIEPTPASAVQRTVDVMDVSDRLGLQKSLRMDIQVVPADSAAGGGAP